jgi:RNA polymerase sigma factor (sigma-70 family)
MEDKPLTEEQRQLAAENHNLIYAFAKQNCVDLEEVYGDLAIGLCKAAKAYDELMGLKFSTFAFACMKVEYVNYQRTKHAPGQIPEACIISYDALTVCDNKDGDTFSLSIVLQGSDDVEYDISVGLVDNFIKTLTPSEKTVVYVKMQNYPDRVAGDYLNVTHQYINALKHRIRKKWLKYMAWINALENR